MQKPTKQDLALAAIKPGEVVSTTTMRSRLPDWDRSAISQALRVLSQQGRLDIVGVEANWQNGVDMRLYARSGTVPVGVVPSAALGTLKPRKHQDDFIAIYTPPLPAFRIKSTRKVLNLTGRDNEDDEMEVAA